MRYEEIFLETNTKYNGNKYIKRLFRACFILSTLHEVLLYFNIFIYFKNIYIITSHYTMYIKVSNLKKNVFNAYNRHSVLILLIKLTYR